MFGPVAAVHHTSMRHGALMCILAILLVLISLSQVAWLQPPAADGHNDLKTNVVLTPPQSTETRNAVPTSLPKIPATTVYENTASFSDEWYRNQSKVTVVMWYGS